MEARGIDASGGKLTSTSEGEIELEDGVLVIKRIRVHYALAGCPADKRDAAERAHAHHASKCPVHKSIGNCIAMSTDLQFL
ncbi:MAG: hypothetical protein E6I78_13815 [Chloroflexi bacterium]|nr:MAG: hypothetical protein E6I78_13815 [Chloroflexota bacterium]